MNLRFSNTSDRAKLNLTSTFLEVVYHSEPVSAATDDGFVITYAVSATDRGKNVEAESCRVPSSSAASSRHDMLRRTMSFTQSKEIFLCCFCFVRGNGFKTVLV